MIYLITKATNSYGLISFQHSWGKMLNRKVKLVPYERLVRSVKFFPGTYIFADYDMLSPKQTEIAGKIYGVMEKQPEQFLLINHPEKSLSRYDLLKKLYEEGINEYNAFRTIDAFKCNFPAFVRKETFHTGRITSLIYNPEELNSSVKSIIKEGFPEEGILVTEFCDTSDQNGVFRKYSAFILGDVIIPRHIFFSREWMIRSADMTNAEMNAEEMDFILSNPHEKQLQHIFKIAGVKYGRIDYSMKNGNVVVWEINPNPMIASSSSLKKMGRQRIHHIFSAKMVRQFLEVNMNNNKKQSLSNPVFEGNESHDFKKVFPFSRFNYFKRKCYFHIKSILLFNFYSIRNRILLR